MKRTLLALTMGAGVLAAASPTAAQTFPTDNPVIRQIWEEGMQNSQTYPLAQALLDSIGPRLTGSPGQKAANDWAVAKYRSWGIEARNEQYGTWTGWRRGITHIDLLSPRVRTLEGTILAWSPGTKKAVEGTVVVLPEFRSEAEFRAWLPQVKGKFVLTSMPQMTCRPDATWKEFATPASFEALQTERRAAQEAWNARIAATGVNARDLPIRLEEAGAAGILTSYWSAGYGVTKIFNARTKKVPTLDLSCEDYGLVFRLAEHNQSPKLRVNADAQFLGDLPTFNTIAEIKGSEKPEEYVVLSAHFDSWDGGSGATDNGTGTVTMMEAMRILKKVYPNPKRTILVGHWSGEEQGLNGSRAFAQDHPEVVEGMQALFNQDNGTGRVVNISMQGFTEAGSHFGRWLSEVPSEITQHIELQLPGTPGSGGTDHAAFVCHGAPAFNLSALHWEYGIYTWHTNRDTFDKIVFDDLKNNAVLTAMLAYLASEDPERVSREQRVLPDNPRTGTKASWPVCPEPVRNAANSPRM
jgi:hypothetical protein